MTAIYARQSADKGEQSLSIESQIEECKKRVFDGDIVEIYHDKGFSGSNIDRPAFTRLMNDIKHGGIRRLIVWKLDRISRSLMDFANILSLLETKKVAFDSVTEQLDTASPMGRAMINIIMVFAQLERETIQMRIIANYVKRAERGFYLGGPPPFGLAKRPIIVDGYKTSTYELCPEHGHTLLLIFEKYACENISLGVLVRHLNNNGFTFTNGKRWESQRLSRIFHNPIYVMSDADIYQFYKAKGVNALSPVDDFAGNGLYLFGKRKANGGRFADISGHSLAVALHKGVIDSRTWLNVQYKLAENVQLGQSGRGQNTWLAGLVKCAVCGYAMTGQKVKRGIILRCSRRGNYRDCSAKCTRADDIESQVWSTMLLKLEELRDVEFTRQANQSAARNQIKIELVKVEEQIDRLVSALADGNAPKSVTARISNLETRQTELLAELQKEKAKPQSVDTDELLALVREDLTLEEKKQVAKAIIERVLVKTGETPVIEWRF